MTAILILLFLADPPTRPSTSIPLEYLLPPDTRVILDAASIQPETIQLFHDLYPIGQGSIHLMVLRDPGEAASKDQSVIPDGFIFVTGPNWNDPRIFPRRFVHLRFAKERVSEQEIQDLITLARLKLSLSKII